MYKNGFVEIEWDVWDEEKCQGLEDTLFNALYALNEESFNCLSFGGRERRIYTCRDHLASKVIGCYFPPKGRVFYTNTLDLRADGEPEIMALSWPKGWYNNTTTGFSKKPDMESVVFYPIKKPPKGIKLPSNYDRVYKCIKWDFYADGIPSFKLGNFYSDEQKESNLSVISSFISVNFKTETATACFDKRPYSGVFMGRDYLQDMFYITASAYSDMKKLWNVSVSMEYSKMCNITLMFGVHEEHVKSLLYSREAPVTASGRKRPIQHWVSSHNRRINNGVDVKIPKHLRGVTDFLMHGYQFRIISPKREESMAIEQYERRAIPITRLQNPRLDQDGEPIWL